MTNCYAIYRAERFSPNSVQRDRAILDAVCQRLMPFWHTYAIQEEDITGTWQERVADEKPLILSMARSREVLSLLSAMQDKGAVVINDARSMLKLSRSAIDRIMRENGIPAAPLHGNGGWWIKRGDETAQEKGDVRFAADCQERDLIIGEMKRRGITDLVTTAHVEGDLVKFYGVEPTGFFSTVYPADSGFSKFGDESRNGKPQYTAFDRLALKRHAARLASITGIGVYGGDCIVRRDGSYAIIDFNDWPSFSTCRQEAAGAIAELALAEYRKESNYSKEK